MSSQGFSMFAECSCLHYLAAFVLMYVRSTHFKADSWLRRPTQVATPGYNFYCHMYSEEYS